MRWHRPQVPDGATGTSRCRCQPKTSTKDDSTRGVRAGSGYHTPLHCHESTRQTNPTVNATHARRAVGAAAVLRWGGGDGEGKGQVPRKFERVPPTARVREGDGRADRSAVNPSQARVRR